MRYKRDRKPNQRKYKERKEKKKGKEQKMKEAQKKGKHNLGVKCYKIKERIHTKVRRQVISEWNVLYC